MFACSRAGFQFMHVDCQIAGVVYSWLLTCNWATATKFGPDVAAPIDGMYGSKNSLQDGTLRPLQQADKTWAGLFSQHPLEQDVSPPGRRKLFCGGTKAHGGTSFPWKPSAEKYTFLAKPYQGLHEKDIRRTGKLVVYMAFIRAYVDRAPQDPYYTLGEAVLHNSSHMCLENSGLGPCSTEYPTHAYACDNGIVNSVREFVERSRGHTPPKTTVLLKEQEIPLAQLNQLYTVARALRIPNKLPAAVGGHSPQEWFKGISFRVLTQNVNHRLHRVMTDAFTMGVPHDQFRGVDIRSSKRSHWAAKAKWAPQDADGYRIAKAIVGGRVIIVKVDRAPKPEERESLSATVGHLLSVKQHFKQHFKEGKDRWLIVLADDAFLPSFRFWPKPIAECLDKSSPGRAAGLGVKLNNHGLAAVAYSPNAQKAISDTVTEVDARSSDLWIAWKEK